MNNVGLDIVVGIGMLLATLHGATLALVVGVSRQLQSMNTRVARLEGRAGILGEDGTGA